MIDYVKIQPRNERLETTRQRLSRILNMTAEREDKKRGFDPLPELDEHLTQKREQVINEILESFDECGFFIGYVGDE